MRWITCLPGPVGGMRLAGDDDLHRPVRRRQQARQAVLVAEQEVGALVGGEAAREADGECLGIEPAANLAQPVGRLAVPRELASQPSLARSRSSSRFCCMVRTPTGPRR